MFSWTHVPQYIFKRIGEGTLERGQWGSLLMDAGTSWRKGSASSRPLLGQFGEGVSWFVGRGGFLFLLFDFFVLFYFTKCFSETGRLNLLTLTLAMTFSSVILFPLPLALLFSLKISFCETFGGKSWKHKEGKVIDELAPSLMSIETRLTLWVGLGQCGGLDIQIHSLPLEITCVGWAEFSLSLLHMKRYLNGSLVKTYKSSMLIFLEQWSC